MAKQKPAMTRMIGITIRPLRQAKMAMTMSAIAASERSLRGQSHLFTVRWIDGY